MKYVVVLVSVVLILSLAACASAQPEEHRQDAPEAQTGDRVNDAGQPPLAGPASVEEAPAEEMAPLPTQSAAAEPELAEAGRAGDV
ncbi:MAG: hypothetical protein P8Z40_09055, partial [Chloroflexota bacterium]